MRYTDLLNEHQIQPVFHGTDHEFDHFKMGMPSSSGVNSQGIFFTDSLAVAAGYGDKVIRARLTINEPLEFDFQGRSRVFFNGKHCSPSDLTHEIVPIIQDIDLGYELPDIDESDLRYELVDAGWDEYSTPDGLILKNIDDSMSMFGGKTATHYVVFDVSQIKRL